MLLWLAHKLYDLLFCISWQFCLKFPGFFNFWRNTTASTETFSEKKIGRNFALHFTSYLSIPLSKILPHSKTIKNAMKLSVFCKNDYRRLSNLLKIHILWNHDHISWTYNQINYNNIWFAKEIIILIKMALVLFFDVFSEKDPHLNTIEKQAMPVYCF